MLFAAITAVLFLGLFLNTSVVLKAIAAPYTKQSIVILQNTTFIAPSHNCPSSQITNINKNVNDTKVSKTGLIKKPTIGRTAKTLDLP